MEGCIFALSLACTDYQWLEIIPTTCSLLIKRISKAGYQLCHQTSTPGLWKHGWSPITFTVSVDKLKIKVKGAKHTKHITRSPKKYYKVTVDWKGINTFSINLPFDYENSVLNTSVPGFVERSLNKYQHPTPATPQQVQTKATPINYGARRHVPRSNDNLPTLPQKCIEKVQFIVGTFMWYSCDIDTNMVQTPSSITRHQAKATQQLHTEVEQFLDDCGTRPDTMVRYHVWDKIIALHSAVSHLSEITSKGRGAGHFHID